MVQIHRRRLIGLMLTCLVSILGPQNFHCNAQDVCDSNTEADNDDVDISSDYEPKLQQLQDMISRGLELRDEKDRFEVETASYLRGIDHDILHGLFDDESPAFTKRFNVRLEGAAGDGTTNDTDAFLSAWAKACTARNGEVYVPSGYTFLVYPSTYSGPCRCSIRFAVEGTIIAPEETSAWDGLSVHYWILFEKLEYFTLLGRGTFNGRGQNWWVCKEDRTCPRAPNAVTVSKSSNVVVRYITIVDSPQIQINFQSITDGHVKGIKVQAPWWSPNTDGIHVSGTTNFAVQNCHVATGDDCVSIVSGSHNIAVQNTYCGLGCHGISVGSLGANGEHANVTKVQVKNCQLESTTNGLRVKTWQGGAGIASNFDFRHINMKNVSNPIIIDQYYCPPSQISEPCTNVTDNVHVDLIKFTNITGTSASSTAVKLACSESVPCTNIRMKDINITRMTGNPARAACTNAFGVAGGFQNPPSCLETNSSSVSTPLRLCYESYRVLQQLWDILFM